MTAKSIMPCIMYKDALSAIDWLCNAFGFEKHQIYAEGDIVSHAELISGDVMIMVGSQKKDTEFSKLTTHPEDIGGGQTQSPYVVIENIDEHYMQAKEHGAKIVTELAEQDYGGKNYACYDCEGHLWNFGSYDPWKTV